MKINLRLWIVLSVLTIALGNSFAALPAAGISWHKGTVESAYEQAKKSNMPLFLYWGAVWCPPCNQIKKTIFSTKEFQQTIKKFVAVYLDGDEDRAQIWSEKLGAKGYPTMLILKSTGEELMRMPTGLSLGRYISLMKSSIQEQKPLKDIVQQALIKKVSKRDWIILGGYSWDQDHERTVLDKDKIKTFRQLYLRCPGKYAETRSRLFMVYLNSLIDQKGKGSLIDLRTTFVQILSQKHLLYANLETIFFRSKEIINFIYPKIIKIRGQMISRIILAMNEVTRDKKLSLDERISALAPSVYLHQIDDENRAFSKRIKKAVAVKVAWCDKEAKDPYSRQAAMSTGVWLLRKTGQYDLAKKYAEAELKISVAPFYFMAALSKIADKSGNKVEALKWLEKGWQSAVGPATRFQWGISYLQGMLQFSPALTDLMIKTFPKVFKEMLKCEDGFSGRNSYRLKRLKESMAKWNEKKIYQKQLVAIKDEISDECEDSKYNSEKCLQWVKNLH